MIVIEKSGYCVCVCVRSFLWRVCLIRHLLTQRDVAAVLGGGSWRTADVSTTRFTVYDTLDKVYKLFATLLARTPAQLTLWNTFSFLPGWAKLSDADKKAKYSEFACHELNFFLFCKDKAFFNAVVLPFISNKLQKVGLNCTRIAQNCVWFVAGTVSFFLFACRIINNTQHTHTHTHTHNTHTHISHNIYIHTTQHTHTHTQSFLDRWFIKDDLSSFLVPSEFEALNTFEQTLLAAAFKDDARGKGVADFIVNSVSEITHTHTHTQTNTHTHTHSLSLTYLLSHTHAHTRTPFSPLFCATPHHHTTPSGQAAPSGPRDQEPPLRHCAQDRGGRSRPARFARARQGHG